MFRLGESLCRSFPAVCRAAGKQGVRTSFQVLSKSFHLIRPTAHCGLKSSNSSASEPTRILFEFSTAMSTGPPKEDLQADRLDLSGIYPPIATPFNPDESISYDKLESNLTVWNKIPFRGYVVQGSNGEYVFLTDEERVDMVKRVRALTPPDKLIIAGSGCESTQATVRMTERMGEAGADAVLVITPSYYKNGMNNEALYKHFITVADKSRVPVIVYNVPGNTGLDIDPEVVVKLSSHPNIIGLKDSAGDISKIGNLVYRTKANNFQILAGSASFLYPALTVGCVGGICALANVMGDEVCRLYELHKQSKHHDAQYLQHRLIAPNMAVTRQYGVPGLKQAMEWFGLYGGPTRSPLVSLTQAQTETLRKSFTNNLFLQ